MSEAWVTLATNDSYALGALVLANSLIRVGTTRQLAVLITPGVSPTMRAVLESVFNAVTQVDVLDSEDATNLALLTRPELGITFTKINAWKLPYEKCVFLDADTLVLAFCDELFDREELSAAPDAGWPDCFNSGVFVFRPSAETYASLISFALEHGSFDGGDQGLLNSYFKDWSVSDISRHLPFIYNMVASAVYSYLPAYKMFGQNVKIAHFIGPSKPWLQYFDSATGQVGTPQGQEHLQELLQAWWNIFRADVHPKLTPQMGYEEQSATLMEQVQSTHSLTESITKSAQSYSPPSAHSSNNVPLDRLNVAIQRFTPDYVQKAVPPQPSPPPAPPYSQPPPPSNFPSTPPHHHTPAFSQAPPSQYHAQPSQAGASPLIPPTPQTPAVLAYEETDRPFEPEPSRGSSDSADLEHNVDSGSKGLAGAYAQMSLEGSKSSEQLVYEDTMRKHAWEQGQMDYLGKDSFDNILKKLQQSMAQAVLGPQPKEKSPPPATPVEPAATPAPAQPSPEPKPEIPAAVVQQAEVAPPQPVVEAAPVLLVTPGTPVASQAPAFVAKPEDSTQAVAVVPVAVQASAPAQEVAPAQAPAPAPVSAPAPPTASLAAQFEAPPTPPVAPAAVQEVPIEEPMVTQVRVAECDCPLPPKPSEPVASLESEILASAPPAKTAEDLEEEVLAVQRAALEKKLAEQKRTAEQKLLEERAAEAAKVKAATGGAVPAKESSAGATGAAGATSGAKPQEPKAPPRKAPAKARTFQQIGFGLGILVLGIALGTYAFRSRQ